MDSAHSGYSRSVRAAVVVAHPGHELRVFGWIEQARPIACVLTDGSGRTGSSRLSFTTSLLESTGATLGPVCGQLTDADLYSALLDHRHEAFIEMTDRI